MNRPMTEDDARAMFPRAFKLGYDAGRREQRGVPAYPVVLNTTSGEIRLTAVEADRVGQALMAAAKRHWHTHEEARS